MNYVQSPPYDIIEYRMTSRQWHLDENYRQQGIFSNLEHARDDERLVGAADHHTDIKTHGGGAAHSSLL